MAVAGDLRRDAQAARAGPPPKEEWRMTGTTNALSLDVRLHGTPCGGLSVSARRRSCRPAAGLDRMLRLRLERHVRRTRHRSGAAAPVGDQLAAA